MIYLHIFNADGSLKIRQPLVEGDEPAAIAGMNGSDKFSVGESPHMPDDVYFDAGAVVAMPAKPSKFHRFDFVAKQWRDPRTVADLWAEVRAQRDTLLAVCDWTQLPDVPAATQAAWAPYRQALRDITNQSDPLAIEWPTQPI